MQVSLQIVAFSWQNDGSGRPVLTKESALRVKLINEREELHFTDEVEITDYLLGILGGQYRV